MLSMKRLRLSVQVPFLHHRRGWQACQTTLCYTSKAAQKRGRMQPAQSQKSPARGLFLFFVILGATALLGGLYGPPIRATAAGSDDVQDSVKSFTRVLSVVE